MSRIIDKVRRERSIETLLVCAIIVCSTIIVVPYMIPSPPPEITLRILTHDAPPITLLLEEYFLNSSYAEEYNIVDIEWVDFQLWNAQIGSGMLDAIMGPYESMSSLGLSGYLSPISRDVVQQVNESIAGVSLMGYDEGQTIWCSYSMHVINFELIVNETMLLENGLGVPDTIEDLLSPQYSQYGSNASLIGMDFPEKYSMGHIFQHMITNAFGWANGIQNLTALYANSKFYMIEGSAENALLNGEVAVILTAFTGQPHAWLPPSLSRINLENQVIVIPDLVGIDNSSEYKDESEAFIEFLISPKGQSVFLLDESSRLPVRIEAFDYVVGIYYDSIQQEFIWTSRAEGAGVDEALSLEDFALREYMNSTAFSARSNLTNCWENICTAYVNGSISLEQSEQFKVRLGDPLTIIDPDTNSTEIFSLEYSFSIFQNLLWPEYELEISHRWKLAADIRYEAILNELSLLL